MTEGMNTDV